MNDDNMLCGDRDKTVHGIISECRKLTQKEYGIKNECKRLTFCQP